MNIRICLCLYIDSCVCLSVSVSPTKLVSSAVWMGKGRYLFLSVCLMCSSVLLCLGKGLSVLVVSLSVVVVAVRLSVYFLSDGCPVCIIVCLSFWLDVYHFMECLFSICRSFHHVSMCMPVSLFLSVYLNLFL